VIVLLTGPSWHTLEPRQNKRSSALAHLFVTLSAPRKAQRFPSIAKDGDLTSIQIEWRVCLSSLRRRVEATKGQHDHAEKGDSRAAVLALPQGWAAKGRRKFFSRAPLRVNLRRMPGVNYTLTVRFKTSITAVHFTSFLKLRPANRANEC